MRGHESVLFFFYIFWFSPDIYKSIYLGKTPLQEYGDEAQ